MTLVTGVRRAWTVALSGLAMAGFLLLRQRLGGAAEAATAVLVAAGAVALALFTGSTFADLGLSTRRLRSGAAWGLLASVIAVTLVLCVFNLSFGAGFFDDDRYDDLSGSHLAFELLVRIPLATALFEEVLFRGALLALLARDHGTMVAVAASSLAFGLWHVWAATDFADANEGLGSAAVAVIPLTIVATGLAGVVLAWLRLRSGSLLAPAMLHATVNATAVVLVAWST